jgi:outer membrane protein OmpA-like peptidoglycan-associated protein
VRLARVALLLFALVVPSVGAIAAERPEVITLNQRLAALQSDPELAGVGAYERLRAQQAVAALAKAGSRDRAAALHLADRRVDIAETAARTEATRRELQRLDQTRNELLLEASRREVARARQETERLRIQAQIQAEEAERLRLAAEAEALARQDAEETLTTVAGRQTQRLTAAREQQVKLARQEAELVSGATLPKSRFGARGEVFTLGSDAFEAGRAKLSASGAAAASALAAYLQVNPKSSAHVEGYGDSQTSGNARAEALRDALVGAGVGKNRLQVSAKDNGSRARAVELVIAP